MSVNRLLRFQDSDKSLSFYLKRDGYTGLKKVRKASGDVVKESLQKYSLKTRRQNLMLEELDTEGNLIIYPMEAKIIGSTLIKASPHAIIEGALIAAVIKNISVVSIYLHGEQTEEKALLVKARDEATHEALFSPNMRIEIVNAYCPVASEKEECLLSVEGKKSRGGCFSPASVLSFEDVASLSLFFRYGGQWFSEYGIKDNPGTTLVGLFAQVENACVYEIPKGSSFSDLFSLSGGVRGGRALKCVVAPYGEGRIYSSEEIEEIAIYDASLDITEAFFYVIAEDICMLRVLWTLVSSVKISCCNRCVAGRVGVAHLNEKVQSIILGSAIPSDYTFLLKLADSIIDSASCNNAKTAARMLKGVFEKFEEEVLYALNNKRLYYQFYREALEHG